MDFKRFSLLIIIRTVLAMMTLVLFTQALTHQGYHASLLLLSAILIFQFFEITRFISKTNTELVRFFDAIRHADFSQRFELKAQGTGFDELGSTFTEILKRIQTVRSSQESELRQVKAIIEHVPVPLLSIASNGSVTLWNNSVRRLFGAHTITRVEDFSQFDSEFPKKLQSILAGNRSLVNITIDDMEHRLIISATEITTATHKETLLSLQDIQSELAIAQLQAWQDLVSVLTHEIMNSITPVASLAKTAVDLVEDVQAKTKALPDITDEVSEELDDVLGAVKTVARRSDGLMQFVTSYRRLTKLPVPNRRTISVNKLLTEVTSLTTSGRRVKAIDLTTSIIPSELDVNIDVDMIEQVLINLLQNAEQALSKTKSPKITMKAYLNLRGHVVFEVSDNGNGIEQENIGQIFVPFFTTKKEGSGVGLALTRQVMIAHEGKVSVRNNSSGGATFSLIF
jgi:nitrogen fixation/metabolism regulation signal transduction histidine kinase